MLRFAASSACVVHRCSVIVAAQTARGCCCCRPDRSALLRDESTHPGRWRQVFVMRSHARMRRSEHSVNTRPRLFGPIVGSILIAVLLAGGGAVQAANYVIQWAAVASMGSARADVGGATASHGKIHVRGGVQATFAMPLDTVEEYDPISRTSRARAKLPWADRNIAAVATSNGKVYAVGGITSLIAEYDPGTDA